MHKNTNTGTALFCELLLKCVCDAHKALYASAYASANRAQDGGISECIITTVDSSNYLVLK